MAGDNILKGVIKIEAPGVQQTVSDVTQNLNTLSNNVGLAATKVSDHMKKAGMATFLARDAVLDLGHVARDLPYAANNFAILAGPIGKISSLMSTITQETGSFKGALGALGGALTGGGGLVIGLELAVSLFTLLAGRESEAAQEAKDAGEQFKTASDFIAKGGGEYQSAFVSVQSLRSEINLAKQGFISKTEVVKEFNKTIGETVGKVNSLEEAEASLNRNADAYIKFTLYKAAANLALQKASDAALKAAENQTKEVDLNKVQKVFNPEKNTDQAFGQLLANTQQYNEKFEFEADKQKQESKNFIDIAKNFQEQAAKLAKDFKFDFFEGEFNKKTKAPKLEKLEVPVRTIVFTAPDRIQFNVPLYGYSDNPQLKKLISEQLSQVKDAKVPVLPEFKDDGQWTKGFIKMLKAAEIKKSLEDLTKELEKTIESGLANIGAGIGKAIGDAISGTGDFSDAFKGVFSELGALIEQLGEAIIQYGIAKEIALKAIQSLSPGAAIAAGVGLVILGEVIKSSLSKPQKFAQGGFVPGVGDQDSVPALLMPGEYVIPKNLVQQVLSNIKALSSFKGFASSLNSSITPSVAGFNVSPLHIHITGESKVKNDHILTAYNLASQKRGRSY